jgi:hypothetical protein
VQEKRSALFFQETEAIGIRFVGCIEPAPQQRKKHPYILSDDAQEEENLF